MTYYMKFEKIKMIFLDFFKDESKVSKFDFQFIHTLKNFLYIFQSVFILRFIKRQYYEIQKNLNVFHNIEFYFYK